jgi:outer membrane protein TolC
MILSASPPVSAAPASGVSREAPPASGDLVSLDLCLRLAWENHPDLRAGQAAVRKAEGVLAQQVSGWNPTLDLDVNPTLQDGDQYHSASIGVNQLISDGGKTDAAVAAARKGRDAAVADLERTWQEQAYSIREAYCQLLQDQRDLEVAEDSVGLYERHLTRAKGRFSVGSAPRSDVTAAEVQLSQARLTRIQAASAVELARRTLVHSVGVPDLPEGFRVLEPSGFGRTAPLVGEAMKAALNARPDLAAQQARIDQAEQTLRYQIKGQNAEISAFGSYSGYTGSEVDDGGNWEAGISLSWALVDGGENRALVDQARAARDSALAEGDALKQTVALEVKQALLKIREYQEKQRTQDLLVRQAKENLDIAQGRYQAGVGYYLEVNDAVEKYDEARRDAIKNRYDLWIAESDLDKATGTRISMPKTTAAAGSAGAGAAVGSVPAEEGKR